MVSTVSQPTAAPWLAKLPSLTSALPSWVHPNGLDVCPVEKFLPALDLLASRLRSGTLERVGGTEVVVSNFLHRFTRQRCRHNIGERSNNQDWPASRRSDQRPPLLVDMGDGTTGTRFLACVTTRLKIKTNHNIIKDLSNRTAFYDSFDAVMDSPVPYELDGIFATHAPNQTAPFISVRDPWDWVRSRRTHHPGAADWASANGGCGTQGAKVGTNDSAINDVARDLVTWWSWALCVAAERSGAGPSSVPIINLFDDDQCESALTMLRAMQRSPERSLPRNGVAVGRVWGSCGQNLTAACAIWDRLL